MNNQYTYVVFTDFQIPVFCPKPLQLFQHAASFATFPFNKKNQTKTIKSPLNFQRIPEPRLHGTSDNFEKTLFMQQTKIYNICEVGKTCCILLWSMVSSMNCERLDLYSVLLSNMQSSSMIEKMMILLLEQNQKLCFFTSTERIVTEFL